jgi:tRNA nucleotidyltransferase/poly(A) polymerase
MTSEQLPADQFGAIWGRPDVARIVSALQPLPVYLVGGALRDLLLGRPVKDFDFLVDCQPSALLALQGALKSALGCTVIVLDDRRGILRACFRDSREVDLAARQGATVAEDLARRDVTFNAMALSCQGDLLDPFGGRADLAASQVRVTAPQVLRDDPLRVLRCLRLAACLDFDLEGRTREAMSDAVTGLRQVAGERIFEELRRFLSHARWEQMEDLRALGILSTLWPQADPDLFLWTWLGQWWRARSSPAELDGPAETPGGPAPLQASDPLSEEQVLSVLAALLLPFCALAEVMLDRLKASNAQVRYLKQWWAGAALLGSGHPTTAPAILGLLDRAGDSLPGLLSFAVLPAFSNPLPTALARRIALAAAGEGELRLSAMPVNGDDLCRHYQRPPGPWLGTMLTQLRVAWACRQAETASELLAQAQVSPTSW